MLPTPHRVEELVEGSNLLRPWPSLCKTDSVLFLIPRVKLHQAPFATLGHSGQGETFEHPGPFRNCCRKAADESASTRRGSQPEPHYGAAAIGPLVSARTSDAKLPGGSSFSESPCPARDRRLPLHALAAQAASSQKHPPGPTSPPGGWAGETFGRRFPGTGTMTPRKTQSLMSVGVRRACGAGQAKWQGTSPFTHSWAQSVNPSRNAEWGHPTREDPV